MKFKEFIYKKFIIFEINNIRKFSLKGPLN